MARIRQTITFTAPQMKWLVKNAAALGVTVSEMIRRIIDRHRETVFSKAPKGWPKSDD
jgi:hypothetical protein